MSCSCRGVGVRVGLVVLGLAMFGGCLGQPSSTPPAPTASGTAADNTTEVPVTPPSATPTDGSAASAATAGTSSAAASTEPAEIDLKTIDQAGLQKLLESHRGKAVFVDFWATWCGPCMKMFPHTVELHHKFADQGLVVVTVAMDEAGDEAGVVEFLRGQKAHFAHFRSRQGAEQEAFDAFDLDNGALPHFKLYGRDGQLVRKFVSGDLDAGPIVPAEVEKAVQQALAAQP